MIEQLEKLSKTLVTKKKHRSQYHALQGAKTLYNIATNTSIRGKARQRLLRTINLQDKLYKTYHRPLLTIEQIEYLERIANVPNYPCFYAHGAFNFKNGFATTCPISSAHLQELGEGPNLPSEFVNNVSFREYRRMLDAGQCTNIVFV